MATWKNVVDASKIPVNQNYVAIINDMAIAIFNINGIYYAIEDNCSHKGLPLSDGAIFETEIECPFHGARFCLKSGEALTPPACENIKTFNIRQENNMLQIEI